MSELVYLPVEQLWPHPDNPRKIVDDLEELTASIKEKGILQNLTVVHVPEHTLDEAERRKLFEETQKYGIYSDGYKKAKALLDAGAVPEHYTVICGHRRLAAAKEAGLKEAPCIIVEMTEKEQIQTMLLENMQRKNLKLYEEAQSFQMLLDFGDSVDDISQASGFSPTTIRRRVKLTELDQERLKEVVDARPIPLGDFEKLSQVEDVSERNDLLKYIGTSDFQLHLNGALRRQAMNKELPKVKAWLKSNKIKKLPAGKTYSSEYEKLGDWNDYDLKDWAAALKKIPKLKPDKNYFYTIDEYSCKLNLYLYKPAERKKRSKAEIEAEKRLNMAWEYMDKKASEMRDKRKAFIDQFTVTKKNESAVLNGAVLRVMAASFHYVYFNNDNLFTLLGVEQKIGDSNNWNNLFDAYRKCKKDNLAKIIYLMWGDDEKLQYPTESNYRHAWPTWSINRILTPLYEWLESLGYEMTQEEKDLMTGKDKIYVKDTELPESSEPIPAEGTAENQDGESGEV